MSQLGVGSVGFRNLNLKPAYDSDDDDILNDFYIPVLSEAIRYNRLAGFFSSTVLAVAARGIQNFILHGGEMELIVGARLSKADTDAIKEGMIQPNKVIAEKFIDDLDNIEEGLIKDHVRALAWLVAQKKLSIKVAIPLDQEGRPLDEASAKERGIFHQKVGVLLDSNNDMISFSGSINETAHGWLQNVEEFKVFKSWTNGEELHLNSDLMKFNKYWNGEAKNIVVMDVPVAVRDKLIQIAPNSVRELELNKYDFRRIEQYPSKIELRPYQKTAADLWFDAGKGFIVMATGTGKTFTALACLDKIRKTNKQLAVIITVPFIHLITQWSEELHNWGLLKIIQASGNSSVWAENLMNEVYDLNNDHSDLLIVITTADTFSSPRFFKIMEKVKPPIMLIADEVHTLGSQQRRKGLKDLYQYRLGLSATPRRWLDDEGTLVLEKYFGNTVFEFSLNDAINAGFLVPYEYYPYFVEMTPKELAEYLNYSRRIIKRYYAAKDDVSSLKILELMTIKRQQIVVNAANKLNTFSLILNKLEHLSYCLIYCSPDQIKKVQDILNDNGIIQHKFTFQESMDERKNLLSSFSDGTYKALLAMRCLDEGVNIPPTRLAIFLASSGNPKQFIQRRGRILRPFPGKTKAVIYDILVVPTITGKIEPELLEKEKKILIRELKRLYEFASSSMNIRETIDAISPIIEKYKITFDEIKRRE